MTTDNKAGSLVKTLLPGIILVIVALWFWHSIVGNPLDELALIRRAQITTGTLVDTYENEQEDSRGKVYYSDIGVYAFRVPDGREFKTQTRDPTGTLEKQREVEYLPYVPSINRVRGDGCRTTLEWLWRTIGLGGLLLAFFVSPGIVLLQNGIRKIRKTHATMGSNPTETKPQTHSVGLTK